jgi:hypothetical protein
MITGIQKVTQAAVERPDGLDRGSPEPRDILSIPAPGYVREFPGSHKEVHAVPATPEQLGGLGNGNDGVCG